MQNQPVVFSKPCNSDFVFLSCIFSYFLFLILYRRPFCSQCRLLKYMYPCIYISTNPSNHLSIDPSIHPSILRLSYHLIYPIVTEQLPPPLPASAQKPRCTALLAGEEAKVVLFVDPDVGPRAVLWVSGWWQQWVDGPQEWAAKVAVEVWPQQKLSQRTFGKALKEWGTNSTGSSTN